MAGASTAADPSATWQAHALHAALEHPPPPEEEEEEEGHCAQGELEHDNERGPVPNVRSIEEGTSKLHHHDRSGAQRAPGWRPTGECHAAEDVRQAGAVQPASSLHFREVESGGRPIAGAPVSVAAAAPMTIRTLPSTEPLPLPPQTTTTTTATLARRESPQPQTSHPDTPQQTTQQPARPPQEGTDPWRQQQSSMEQQLTGLSEGGRASTSPPAPARPQPVAATPLKHSSRSSSSTSSSTSGSTNAPARKRPRTSRQSRAKAKTLESSPRSSTAGTNGGAANSRRKNNKNRNVNAPRKVASGGQGVAASRELAAASGAAAAAGQEDGEALFCSCQTPYDSDEFMIACDGCEEWFHGTCVKVSEEAAELVDKYYCPGCTQKGMQSSWKTKCYRGECTRSALAPASKYCSQNCGLLVAYERLQKYQGRLQNPNSQRKEQELFVGFPVDGKWGLQHPAKGPTVATGAAG